MQQHSSAPRWLSAPPSAIAVHEWDGEFVVRNERTGSTHLLGTLAGRVLEVLLAASHSLDRSEIAARLEPAGSRVAGSGIPEAIDRVLAEFRRLGLADLDNQ